MKNLVAAALLLPPLVLAQAPDAGAGREHFFPFVVDGDGFRSHLFLGNASASANECMLRFQGREGQGGLLDSARLQSHDALSAAGADVRVELADADAGVIFATAGERELAFGYAALDCLGEVSAWLLLTLEDFNVCGGGETLVAMTAAEGARAAPDFVFHIPRRLANFGMAFSNDGSAPVSCAIDIVGAAGAAPETETIVIAERSTGIHLLSTSQLPAGAWATASCDTDIAALGMSFGDTAFSALRPVSPGVDETAAESLMLPLILDGDGFHSELFVVNPGAATNRCEMHFGGDLDIGRFTAPDRAGATASGFAFTLGGGDQITFAGKGESSLALGYARVECDEPVVTGNALQLAEGDGTAAMAAIPAMRPAEILGFPIFPGSEGVAMAFSNIGQDAASCSVDLAGNGGRFQERGVFVVDRQSTLVAFLGELISMPGDFAGGTASIFCDRPVGAVSLPFSGTAFTALAPDRRAVDAPISGTAPVFDPADFPPLMIFPLDEPVSPMQLPAARGGEPPLAYSLAPEVPGMRFDPAGREFGGTPTEAGEYLVIYEARDSDGDRGSFPLFILVRGPDTAPGFAGADAPTDRTYTLDVEIEPLQLPEATGGDEPLTHFLLPEVPGLEFDPATRRLSGAPTRAGVYGMTYTAADLDFDVDTLEFTITVTVPESARTPLDADRCADGGFVDDPADHAGLVADCRALAGFANALIETGLIMEDNPIRRWGANGQRNLHRWAGIVTANGRVTEIDLGSSALQGNLPAGLTQLDALVKLDLNGNDLTGSVPPSFGGLPKLRILNLSWNRLSGAIPPELSRLGELETLDLSGNALEGAIPPELSRLARLQFLLLGFNAIDGGIPPQLGRLGELVRLSLSGNRLGGEIPLELAQLGQLTELQLGSNRLSGGIPRELGQMEKLEDLSLWGNELSGPIPPELTGLKRLRNLDLSLNELTGAIPSAFGELMNLESLDLSFNRLREGLPVAIAAAPALAGLDVSFNPMRGTIDWAFRKRVNEDGLLLGVAGTQITGYGPPPPRQAQPASPGNARHHSVAYYQGPLVMEWDWEGPRIEHQTPILGRWALLAVRVDHSTAPPPPVITRVLDAGGAVLADSLAEAAPPVTESIEPGLWRTEFLFHLPGGLHRSGNRVLHVIDPGDDSGETGNAGAPIVLDGETPPRFRAVFVPITRPGEDWHEGLNPNALMAGTLAFLPIADDFEARIGPALELDEIDETLDEPLLELYQLWNAEGEPDEFYHGIVNDNAGGVALLASQVALSELSIHIVIPHEFGHNLNLEHTPGCFAEGVDDAYPYPDGALGPEPAWERNWRLFASGEDEDYTDVMSYCTESKLISDYNYRLASEYWLAFGARSGAVRTGVGAVTAAEDAGAFAANAASASAGDAASIALSGRVEAGGIWRLTQAELSDRQPRPPANDGEYTLVLLDAAGVQVHAEPLTVSSSSVGDASFWAARVPMPLREPREVVILDNQGNEVLRETLPQM